jgi:succinate dehydrogenase/fumarate reductase flavoprotein subunit
MSPKSLKKTTAPKQTLPHKEADVIVVGYGLAGGVSAISAHDAGAKVLILEKTPHPGGCSILAGGAAIYATNTAEAAQYLTRLSKGTVNQKVVEAMAQGLFELPKFFEQLAKTDNAKIFERHLTGDAAGATYPNLPGAQSIGGALMISEIPGFKGFPWIVARNAAGQRLVKLVIDNVDSRNIPVLFETAAKRLLQDSSGRITGVIAEQKGKKFTLKAKKAVILATGGFEHNEWLKLQYLEAQPVYSMAPLGNTGDGVILAQKAGAALWHMWHVHGSYGFKFPEYPVAFRFSLGGFRNDNLKMPWINVDKFGRRFMNEYPRAPQDTGHRPLEFYDAEIQDFPRIPCYLIFDEAGRKLRPIAAPLLTTDDASYHWSEDNSAEIQKGWILKTDTLEELAAKIAVDPAALKETVARWNDFHVKGEDADFHRPKGTIVPIKEPPFYALQAWPIITNTQGGPEHNEKQQVVDSYGEPIPGLYAAGELGSFYGHLYQLGGNIAECFVGGRIAGKNAAGQKPADARRR